MIPRPARTARTGRTADRPAPAGFDRRLIAPMLLGSVLNPATSSVTAVALVVGGVVQIAACGALLLVGSGSAPRVLLAAGAVTGVPQGLIGLANQNALHRQADPARIASAAGLLRTFMYLGALAASAATAAFFPHRADNTSGLHGLALFMLAGSLLLLASTLPDRSLRTLTPRKA